MNPNIRILHVQLGYSRSRPTAYSSILTATGSETGADTGGRVALARTANLTPRGSVATVFTHPKHLPALADESTEMCLFRFKDQGRPGVEYVTAAAAFDWDTAWAELAAIELAALGEVIHGKRLAERMNPPRPDVSLGYSPRRTSKAFSPTSRTTAILSTAGTTCSPAP